MITAAIVYVMQKGFDRALEIRVGKILEVHKQAIQEQTRRKAALYDEQADYLKKAINVTYRIRNQVRRVTTACKEHDPASLDSLKQDRDILKHLDDELQTLMYEARAVLPHFLFQQVHSLSRVLGGVSTSIENYITEVSKPPPREEVHTQFVAYLSERYEATEKLYIEMTESIHSYLRVEEGAML